MGIILKQNLALKKKIPLKLGVWAPEPINPSSFGSFESFFGPLNPKLGFL